MQHRHSRNAGPRSSHHDCRHHHTNRAAPWFVVAAVALIAAIVAGCASGADSAARAATASETTAPPSLLDADFVPACNGVGVPEATTLSQTPGVVHPVLVLAGAGGEMSVRRGAVRGSWTRSWTRADPMALAAVELVACVEPASTTKVAECTGYEIDGAASDAVVNLNEIVYHVSLHAARTGELLAATRVTARDDTCPKVASFAPGQTTIDHDPFDTAAIETFVEPYVTP